MSGMRHGSNGTLSPVEFERRHFERLEGVKQARGDSPQKTTKNTNVFEVDETSENDVFLLKLTH
jgi:hypothetical protein